jgi:hypothetical protein
MWITDEPLNFCNVSVAIPGVSSDGGYSFPAFTKSRTCVRNHPRTATTVMSRRLEADDYGLLPAKAPGLARAMDGSILGICKCPPFRVDAMDASIGDCLQLKLGPVYVPCVV